MRQVPIVNPIAEYHDELTAWRRHLHERPELGFQEHETAAFVAGKLRSFGVDEVHTALAGTGVVAVIQGAAGGRTIGLRADMDALPIQEATGLPWSLDAGRMHACGHDGHTTMLLGAARYLAETRNFVGTAYLIFQPAEEGGGGGRVMVEDGLFERFPVDAGVRPAQLALPPARHLRHVPGPAMAASDELTIELEAPAATPPCRIAAAIRWSPPPARAGAAAAGGPARSTRSTTRWSRSPGSPAATPTTWCRSGSSSGAPSGPSARRPASA